ncbi:MAG: hypothetical protein K1X83_09730 [Oligoflexia bacterium]|nr:hypothetical protein [Oligoflexia bacterium]
MAVVLAALPAHAASKNLFFDLRSEAKPISVQSGRHWEANRTSAIVRAENLSQDFIFNAGARRLYVAKQRGRQIALASQQVQTYQGEIFLRSRPRARLHPGSFTISVVEDQSGRHVNGYIVTPGGPEFRIESAANGRSNIIELNPLEEPLCGANLDQVDQSSVEVMHHQLAQSAAVISPAAVSNMRVLVVYSAAARAAAGGTSSMLSTISTMVAYANTAYSASGISAQLTLAGTAELSSPDESTDYFTNLNRLTSSDGVWDEVHAMRTQVHADLVSVIVENVGVCGVAWVAPGSASFAFSMIQRSCTSSFAHEIGHNLGALHDLQNAGGANSTYSYGWRFTGNSAQQFRTIMAYAPGTRIQRFSSPLVIYDGQPTGVENAADNARMLNLTVPTAAAYLDEPSGEPTPTPQPGQPTPEPTASPTPGPAQGSITLIQGPRVKNSISLIATLTKDNSAMIGERVGLYRLLSSSHARLVSVGYTSSEGKVNFKVRKNLIGSAFIASAMDLGIESSSVRILDRLRRR